MSKVNVVFFASLKEAIGQSTFQMTLDFPLTIGELKQQLAEELKDGKKLLESGIQSSIDFEFSRDTDTIPETVKEVAFFPPVTGG
jgi:molybdopterin synthase sulfur carrier subunit